VTTRGANCRTRGIRGGVAEKLHVNRATDGRRSATKASDVTWGGSLDAIRSVEGRHALLISMTVNSAPAVGRWWLGAR
jgi:hypothetical protein